MIGAMAVLRQGCKFWKMAGREKPTDAIFEHVGGKYNIKREEKKKGKT
jgi:hypothetical protein